MIQSRDAGSFVNLEKQFNCSRQKFKMFDWNIRMET